MRRVLMIAAALCVVAALASGCGDDSDAAGGGDGGDRATVRSLVDIEPGGLPEGWKLPGKLGHATNYLVHEWYQNMTAAEKAAANDFGIDFSVKDANLDLQKSLAALDDFTAQGTDAVVFTPVDEKASRPAVRRAAREMDIVCEASPVQDCSTLVAIDDRAAGLKEGKYVGDLLKERGTENVKVLDVGLPALSTTVARSEGFAEGLRSVIPDAELVSIDGKGVRDSAVKAAADALSANADVNVIFGINDDSAFGGLQAYRRAGLDTSDLVVAGFGCEGIACKDALRKGGPYTVSAAMFPEFQGQMAVRAAIAAANGVELPDKLVMPSVPVDSKTLSDYYAREGGKYVLDLDAVARLCDGCKLAPGSGT